ncbi:hypothetical protein ES332_A06G179600v1 [Gossypium tomentosum]|uniref:Uncharacterized protein n=1 Tax=Gossypium tomentosum TaxID=34277 RepID=A0A5D2Q8S6_GOSTO|nr:hypothetical protein ES332_A06G179600v1 [Gossypium tomentosum]
MSPFDLRSRPLLFLFLIFGRIIGFPPTSTWFSIAVQMEEKSSAFPWAFHSLLSKILSPLVWSWLLLDNKHVDQEYESFIGIEVPISSPYPTTTRGAY